ncbi:hypothetical protein M9H77_09054 [Catharanthus roseus]|uniref:Uncharacterized protein n=1 Tax=Catharanthus roseus TaxID=4058 RepID=A0ACC0BZU6_CATRO|nr:hypothetical protein M9H77_09054 [Catharanthus roseus]
MYEVRSNGYQANWMTTAQYMRLCDKKGLEACKKRREAAQQNRLQGRVTFIFENSFMFAMGEDGRGLRIVETVCTTASAEGTVGQYTIRPVFGEELKANAERLHILSNSPILTDDQLMFEAVAITATLGRRQQLIVSSFSIFYSRPRGLYREGEEVVGIHAVSTRKVHRLHDIIRISLWSATGFGTHSLPSFPTVG